MDFRRNHTEDFLDNNFILTIFLEVFVSAFFKQKMPHYEDFI